jgi:hypothetical protein
MKEPVTIITLPVAHEEGQLRTFIFHGYGDPTEVSRDEYYGYVLNEVADAPPVWYLNASGYAQKLNSARKPYRKPGCECRDRVLLIPTFKE